MAETTPAPTEADWTPVTPREARVKYVPGSWHNRTSEIIRNLSANVWVVERGYVHMGMDMGGKMTIVRLPDRRLFVHSPLPMNAALKTAIDALGDVSAVVAPNTQHIDFVPHWKKHYPNATYIAPPGFKAEKPDFPFDEELSEDNVPNDAFKDAEGTIKQVYIKSAPAMRETVFFHVPSKTLMVTDLMMTIPKKGVPFGTKVGGVMLNVVFKNLYKHMIVKDKQQFDQCLQQIEAFGFETVVPCHGDIVSKDAVNAFKRFWKR